MLKPQDPEAVPPLTALAARWGEQHPGVMSLGVFPEPQENAATGNPVEATVGALTVTNTMVPYSYMIYIYICIALFSVRISFKNT